MKTLSLALFGLLSLICLSGTMCCYMKSSNAARSPALHLASAMPCATQPAASQPASTQPAASRPEVPRERITINDIAYDLELALTDEQRALGLMHRDHIDPHTGMLFVYPRQQVLGFWMKNCIMDIDVIFLDARGTILALHTMKQEPQRRADESLAAYELRLHSYSSRRPAMFAIELAAGEIAQLDVKVGDRIALEVKKLRALAR